MRTGIRVMIGKYAVNLLLSQSVVQQRKDIRINLEWRKSMEPEIYNA
jgi:hypothetical protein